jgi:hypothetical protein
LSSLGKLGMKIKSALTRKTHKKASKAAPFCCK